MDTTRQTSLHQEPPEIVKTSFAKSRKRNNEIEECLLQTRKRYET